MSTNKTWFDHNLASTKYQSGSSGGAPTTGSGGSGILVYPSLSELLTALPNGSTTPVWVIADNKWYYWSGAITADTTAPTVTANPTSGTYAGTQSVTLTANETATIYYTTDGSAPTQSSAVYSSPISVPATGTIKYFGKDTAGNVSPVQTVSYTITVPDSTPPEAVTNLAAGTPTATTVPLTWTASIASDISKYEVAYSTDGTNFTVASAVVTGVSYTVTGLTASTLYTFRVVAIDTSSNRSTTNPTVQATTSVGSSWVTTGLVTKWDNRTTQLALTNDGSYFPTTGDYTICATVKPKAFLNVISQYNISVGAESNLRLWLDSTGQKVNVQLWGTNNVPAVYSPTFVGPSTLTDVALYYHIVVIKNNTGIKVYVNNASYGTPLNFANTPFTPNANINPSQVKVADAASDVKHVLYYNRELSTEELTQNYDALK